MGFMAMIALVVIVFILGCVMASLVLLGWVMDLMVAIILAICVGMSVDFSCHICHAYVHAQYDKGLSWSEERVARVRYSMGTMGISVTMGALTTLLGGAIMLLSILKFFFQFGVFMFVAMAWSFLFSIIFLPAAASGFGVVGEFGDLKAIFRFCKAKFTKNPGTSAEENKK